VTVEKTASARVVTRRRRVATPQPLPRLFYRRDPRAVAVDLLNKVLLGADGRSGRIVETEAYCGALDPAAHSWRGQTARNATMFGAPGRLYVYFTYGMHWCCNPVCGETGEGVAVLLRALAPLTGLEAMRAARRLCRSDRDLCRGPARLCQALGIDGTQDGIDLVSGAGGFTIIDDGTPPPAAPVVATRVGITRAAGELWRWYVPDDPHVSRR
jgi:DNA-3-methyladenine glycosylase